LQERQENTNARQTNALLAEKEKSKPVVVILYKQNYFADIIFS